MATFTKTLLSGSTNGRAIKVAAIATPGTLVHATGTSAAIIDELWLNAHNTSAASVVLTIEFGGTTSPDDTLTLTIPAKSGRTLCIAGEILTGTGAAATNVRAFAATANVVTISGYVNRIA
jgi:hypothetical protein